MNVITPNNFATLTWPDGKQYIPFEDNYPSQTLNITANGWGVLEITPTRDYSVCKNVVYLMDFGGTHDQITAFFAKLYTAMLAMFWMSYNSLDNKFTWNVMTTNYGGVPQTPMATFKVTGYAPQS